jgi:hypothetical protein
VSDLSRDGPRSTDLKFRVSLRIQCFRPGGSNQPLNNYNKILSQYEFQKDTQGNFKAKCRHCPTYTHLAVRKSLPISRLLKRYVNVL